MVAQQIYCKLTDFEQLATTSLSKSFGKGGRSGLASTQDTIDGLGVAAKSYNSFLR